MVNISAKYSDPRLQPKRAHPTDAGADLRSLESYSLEPGQSNLYDTGVAVKIPEGFVGLLFNRSSQGKQGIKLANSVGVIDASYRGNVKVLLENHSTQNTYHVTAYETKIAQLAIVPVVLAEFTLDETNWDSTARGVGGFGSTGV